MMRGKKNNKGFSLVELIVVIAIMAVLVGILAPTLIKYVDKSRRSTDVKNISEYMSAIQTYASDHEQMANKSATITLTSGGAATVAWDNSNMMLQATAGDPVLVAAGESSTGDTGAALVEAALTDSGLSKDSMKLKSKSWGTDVKLHVYVGNDMQPKFAVEQTAEAGKDYSISYATGIPQGSDASADKLSVATSEMFSAE